MILALKLTYLYGSQKRVEKSEYMLKKSKK